MGSRSGLGHTSFLSRRHSYISLHYWSTQNVIIFITEKKSESCKMMRMSCPSFSDNPFRLAVGGRVVKWAICVCKDWCFICKLVNKNLKCSKLPKQHPTALATKSCFMLWFPHSLSSRSTLPSKSQPSVGWRASVPPSSRLFSRAHL